MPSLPKQYLQIKAIKPPKAGQVDYSGTNDDKGLVLRVSYTGYKTWFMRYSVIRKGKDLRAKKTIGSFPTISLEETRELMHE